VLLRVVAGFMLRVACCVLSVECCVLRVACCVLNVACCVRQGEQWRLNRKYFELSESTISCKLELARVQLNFSVNSQINFKIITPRIKEKGSERAYKILLF
jgi:hypothetical protein